MLEGGGFQGGGERGLHTSCIGLAKSEVAFERAVSTYSLPATLLRISRPASYRVEWASLILSAFWDEDDMVGDLDEWFEFGGCWCWCRCWCVVIGRVEMEELSEE